ncbi:hypothetical protein Zmor_001719 [Zophobas morio]|uniref:Uncharacterized protein n=1 Tax=Zophobas morio TaxID=2755281 RepID=A0AA38J5R5_9CUCU|nr:hypothetical protein Zmor_001719 [Zophobas morio]
MFNISLQNLKDLECESASEKVYHYLQNLPYHSEKIDTVISEENESPEQTQPLEAPNISTENSQPSMDNNKSSNEKGAFNDSNISNEHMKNIGNGKLSVKNVSVKGKSSKVDKILINSTKNTCQQKNTENDRETTFYESSEDSYVPSTSDDSSTNSLVSAVIPLQKLPIQVSNDTMSIL